MMSSRYDGKDVISLLSLLPMSKKPPAPSDTADKFMLRLPDGMRDQIAELAKANGRSMNAEIIARIEFSLQFDAAVDATGPEFAKLVSEKLDAQEALMKETREELALVKAWLQAGKPDLNKRP